MFDIKIGEKSPPNTGVWEFLILLLLLPFLVATGVFVVIAWLSPLRSGKLNWEWTLLTFGGAALGMYLLVVVFSRMA